MSDMLFLKLGGSLITDKDQPSAPRRDVIARLAAEIADFRSAIPDSRLILGHGSGSFGHIPAKKYGTRAGVRTPEGWRGFAEVWLQATALTRLVIEALHDAGLPALAFPPSAAVTARGGRIAAWDTAPIRHALEAGLLPVVHGDAVFDETWGGTIVSTEDVFRQLAPVFQPARILIAGVEEGVWADYPGRTRLVREITPARLPEIEAALHGSAATDVTGGMAGKVREMLALAGQARGLRVLIFNGVPAGRVHAALLGDEPGTLIRSD
jgi:isopentenyl phosphate kinase